MGWHGLIDDVRLSSSALTKEQLLIQEGENKKSSAGYWRFEETPGFFKDSDGLHADLKSSAPSASPESAARKKSTVSKALVDLCHALLNSSEFIYSE